MGSRGRLTLLLTEGYEHKGGGRHAGINIAGVVDLVCHLVLALFWRERPGELSREMVEVNDREISSFGSVMSLLNFCAI